MREIEMMNGPISIDGRTRYQAAMAIAALLFCSYAYFFEGGGWNQNSRFDLTRAIVEKHALTIDGYQENTGDKAVSNGHYYSDKAPGVAFLAVPFVTAARPVLTAIGVDPTSVRGLVILAYVATTFAVGLPSALGASCLFLIGLWLGATVEGAAFASLSLGLATPYWANASMLFGHTLAGASLTFSFAAALALREKNSVRRDLLLGLIVGLAAGWATVTEYPAAPASAVLALLALVEIWPDGWARRGRVVAGVAVGALTCVLILMVYQDLAFGSPFDLGYSHYAEGNFPGMAVGFHGLTHPHRSVILQILISPYSGLLLLGPVVIAAPLGLWLLWSQTSNRKFAVAAAVIAAYYLCMNASFVEWRGGASYGPRYMLAGLPALCIGLAPIWSKARPRWRWLLAALATFGGALSFMAVATNPIQSALAFRSPIFQTILPSFLAGHLSSSPSSVVLPDSVTAHEAFNLGELAGLHGLVSLVPLLVVWCLGAVVLTRILSQTPRCKLSQS